MPLLEELRKVIKEELGISDKVTEISKMFFSEIMDRIPTAEEKEKNDVMIKKEFSLTFSVDDVKISCGVAYRNFLSKDFSKIYNTPYITDGSSAQISNKLFFCFINIFAVCGALNKEKAMETIQHEVEHIFQQIRMGRSFGGDSLYAKIKTDMESEYENRSKVARLLYYTLKPEQEGFINGLYAFLMDSMEPYTEELLKKSEAWGSYVFSRNTFEELKDNPDMKRVFNEYFNDYGITIGKIETELDNLLHRIGRAVIKVKQDKAKQGWR